MSLSLGQLDLRSCFLLSLIASVDCSVVGQTVIPCFVRNTSTVGPHRGGGNTSGGTSLTLLCLTGVAAMSQRWGLGAATGVSDPR